ncbi:hypothetical protein GCM10023339_27460 [Alloalcanivorax gelatiniphagus]
MTTPGAYADLADAAWRWVLDQVRWDDGPWIPETVPHVGGPPEERDGMHSGIGGLAHVLAEVRETRPWTDEESALAGAIEARIRGRLATSTAYSYFDGLVSDLGVLAALRADGTDVAVARLAELAGDDGWEQPWLASPPFAPHTRINDATIGTAGNLLGAVWAHRQGAAGAAELAHWTADILLAEGEHTPVGTNWTFFPRRFGGGLPPERRDRQMPNWSHGLAGIAASLAVAGSALDRPDLVAAARSGAEHLVTLADTSDGGFVVPAAIPPSAGLEEVTYTWCHGPTGTSLLFTALEHAGVAEVAGRSPAEWHRRCLHAVRTSGVPERLRPGFWDNDGRCCGTAGVGEVFLDAWQRLGVDDDLVFAAMRTLVTGGTRGIGAAVARRLAADGHDLVLGYARDDDAAARTAAECRALGVGCTTVRADLVAPGGVEDLFAATDGLTGVVNNAGATLHIGPLADTPPEVVRTTIDLNLTSALLVARAAVRAMARSRGGAGGVLVNISSGAATLGSPGEYVQYAAAKAGVDALTLGLAQEVAGDGIRVVGVAPGIIGTTIHADAGEPGRVERVGPLVPLGRAGRVEEVADAVGWLMSGEAAYVTGTTLRVAGGR